MGAKRLWWHKNTFRQWFISLRASSPIWAGEKRVSRERASERLSREARFVCPNRRACSQANDLSELYKYSTDHKSQGYSDTSSGKHPSLQHSSTALVLTVLRVMECLLFQDRSRKSLAFSAEMATPESQKQRMFYAKSKYDPAPSGIICCVYLLYRLVSRAHLDKRILSLPRLLCSRVVVLVC